MPTPEALAALSSRAATSGHRILADLCTMASTDRLQSDGVIAYWRNYFLLLRDRSTDSSERTLYGEASALFGER